MLRARVFVLRDKQNEVLPACKELIDLHLPDTGGDDDDSPHDPSAVAKLHREVERVFEVMIGDDEFEEVFSSDLALSGLIARRLLDRNPPDTIPPWNAPWDTEPYDLS